MRTNWCLGQVIGAILFFGLGCADSSEDSSIEQAPPKEFPTQVRPNEAADASAASPRTVPEPSFPNSPDAREEPYFSGDSGQDRNARAVPDVARAPDAPHESGPSPSPEPGAETVVVMAAADVQSGAWSPTVNAEKTAKVIEQNNPDFVIAPGDLSNASGTASDYAQYHKSWGRFRDKTYCVSGNHDKSSNAFFDYFNGPGQDDGVPTAGRHTGPRGKGYFSVNMGKWMLIGLNPYATGGKFTRGDEQMTWLEETMRVKPKGVPVVVIEHAPRYTKAAGHDENSTEVSIAWDIFMAHKPDVRLFVTGHMNGVYERWKPMNNKKAEASDGIRSFTVATGGAGSYAAGTPDKLLEKSKKIYGALKLTLRSDGYDWDFKPIEGSTFSDTGTFDF